MEEYYRMIVREKEKARTDWIMQEHAARLATEEKKERPASPRPAFRIRVAIGVALVSLAALALYANVYVGLALSH